MREFACELDETAEHRIDYWENHFPYDQAPARIESIIEKALVGAVILPLYLYDHGGITINTSGFSCPWDSGQIGYIYMTRETIFKEYGGKRLTKKLRTRAESLLRSEVETYDQYIRGEVYGYVADDDGESCWGFFGLDYAREEALRAISAPVSAQALQAQALKAQAQALKAQAQAQALQAQALQAQKAQAQAQAQKAQAQAHN